MADPRSKATQPEVTVRKGHGNKTFNNPKLKSKKGSPASAEDDPSNDQEKDADAELTEKQAKEEKKRKETEAAFQKQKEENSLYMQSKGLTRFKPAYDAQGNLVKPPKPPKNALTIESIATATATDLGKDGIFSHPDYPGQTIISKGGKLSSGKKYLEDSPLPFGSKDYTNYCAAVTQYSAVDQGVRSVTFDLPQPTEKKIMIFLEAAKKRGLDVQFGPNIQKFMDGTYDDKHSAWNPFARQEIDPINAMQRKMRIEAKQKEVNDHSASHEDAERAEFRQGQEIKFLSQSLDKRAKLVGNDDDAKKKAYIEDDVYGGKKGLSFDDKAAKMKDAISEFKTRATQLKTTKNDLNQKISPVSETLRKVDVTQGEIDACEKKIKTFSGAAKSLNKSMQEEYKDLMLRGDALKAELNKGRGPNKKMNDKIDRKIREIDNALKKADPTRVQTKMQSIPKNLSDAKLRVNAAQQQQMKNN